MVIQFACPGCQRILSSQMEHRSKVVCCPSCGQRTQVPCTTPQRRHAENAFATSRENAQPTLTASVLRRILPVFAVVLVVALGATWLWFRESPRPALPSESREDRTTVALVTGPPPSAVEEPLPTPPSTAELPVETEQTASKNSQLSPVPVVASAPASEVERTPAQDDFANPELPFDLVDAINTFRVKAGVDPIFLAVEQARLCQTQAERLARDGSASGAETQDKDLASLLTAREPPLEAVEKWLQQPSRRTAILEPRLRTFGVGFARTSSGETVSVFDWTQGIDRYRPPEPIPPKGAVVYPAPAQTRVPLWFPGNEAPDPLPDTKNKLAGFPVTLTFPPQRRIEAVDAHLSNPKEGKIEVWLSAPESPANPHFASSQRNTICLIARKPLRPSTHYQVEVMAKVDGEPWSAKWDFLTVTEGEIHHHLAGTLLRSFNRVRRHAGLAPVRLDTESAPACLAHARYLGVNAPTHPMLNWNEEKPDLPGYSEEGRAIAQTATIQGGGGPREAVNGLLDSLTSRAQVLDPELTALGLGYTPFVHGGWIWIIHSRFTSARDAEKEYCYPAPDQEGVPLTYPANEVPTPIPAEAKDKRAGYAITVLFGPRARVKEASATLTEDAGTTIPGWLSSPEKPAIAGFSQRSLCYLPRSPLRPNTRYTITFDARVNGRAWRRVWSFSTLKEPDRYTEELAEKMIEQLNTARKKAGLKPVCLDEKLSSACQAHARYLALNHRHTATVGLNVHRQDPNLPGASPEGAQAAKDSVIIIALDPTSCVENWLATLYHRIPLLDPNLERVGFGHARIYGNKWTCVMDTGKHR